MKDRSIESECYTRKGSNFIGLTSAHNRYHLLLVTQSTRDILSGLTQVGHPTGPTVWDIGAYIGASEMVRM